MKGHTFLSYLFTAVLKSMIMENIGTLTKLKHERARQCIYILFLRTWAFHWGIEHQNELNILIIVKRTYREIMYIIILVITELPIPMILVVAAELSQFYATATINLLDHLVSIATVHIPPLTPERWCEHPSVFLVFVIRPSFWHCDGRETDTSGSVDHWQGFSDWGTQRGGIFAKAQRSVGAWAIFKSEGGAPEMALEMTTLYSSPWGKLFNGTSPMGSGKWEWARQSAAQHRENMRAQC